MALSKVYVNLQGRKEEDWINPENFLYAEEHAGNEKFQPCLRLYPLKTVLSDEDEAKLSIEEKKVHPKKLFMTLAELGVVPGFVYVNVTSLVDGRVHPIVLSKSAIISTRKYHQHSATHQLYVVYVVGFNKNTLTLYTADNIAALVSSE